MRWRITLMNKYTWPLLALILNFFTQPLYANLCLEIRNTDKPTDSASAIEADLHQQLFSEVDFHGNRDWNRKILTCNRKRDVRGGDIKRILTDPDYAYQKAVLSKANLPEKLVSGKFNFFGKIVTQQKYRYVLSKTNGEWIMTIPYDPEINDNDRYRIDFLMGSLNPDVTDYTLSNKTQHAWQLYEMDQVTTTGVGANAVHTLKAEAEPIAITQCDTTTYYEGKEGKYDNQTNLDSKKRDRENKHISLGKIQYSYGSSSWSEGCRVYRYLQLFWQPDPASRRVEQASSADTWIYRNFIRTAEEYWSRPDNFKLQILLKGVNDEEPRFSSLVKLIGNRDYLKIRFGGKFMPYKGNQIYKTSLIQFNNFSTMTTDETYWHEVGHAFGLDDEYGGNRKTTFKPNEGSEIKKNGCTHQNYDDFNATTYEMCSVGRPFAHSIYHYIATSRYVLTEICSDDVDCGSGRYCNKRLGLNRCLVDGTAMLGEPCNKNQECSSNRCQGTGNNRQCVCANDDHCGENAICILGTATIGKNSCRATATTSCPSGWKYEIRNPPAKDRCTQVVSTTVSLECKLLATDKSKNWTGPHAQAGRDECRSTRGKKPKGVKCPNGFVLSVRSGADSCIKTATENRQPDCRIGWDYRSKKGRDICQDK